MRTAVRAALGFFVPTLLVVAGLHVAGESSGGELFAGVVSSSWFTALFFAGLVVARAFARRSAMPARSAVLTGLIAGVATWPLVWGLWAGPLAIAPLAGLRGSALAVNSGAMLLAAALVALFERRASPDRSPA